MHHAPPGGAVPAHPAPPSAAPPLVGAPSSSPAPGIDRLPPALRHALGQRQIPKLDGVRAVAALLVVYYHFGLHVPDAFGVLMFFVLSGFLITWLLLKEESRDGTIALRAFYARRTLRIFPAFYAYWLLVTAAFLVLGKPVPWGQAMASFFYVCNYYQGLNGYPSSAYSHTWSLGVEEQFYLLWPAMFVLLRHRPTLRMGVVAGGIVAVWLCRILYQLVLRVPEPYLYTSFETRADQLLVGCLLAMALHQGLAARFWAFLCARPVLVFVPLAVLAMSFQLEAWASTRYRYLFGFTIDSVMLALLLPMLLAAGRHPGVRWLDSRPVRYLGVISYPIYLYQQVVVSPLSKLMRPHDIPRPMQALAVTLVVVFVASASHHVIERPFLRLKERFART